MPQQGRTRSGWPALASTFTPGDANMPQPYPTFIRFIGLDIHKKYFVAAGVNRDLTQVLSPCEVPIRQLKRWAEKTLTPQDAVVLEMTTNTYPVYDVLKPFAGSVTVVHPPHVALIVRAQVKTDKKAAITLAQLHAAGLLPGVWIPPVEVRELRTLIAHRRKMVKLRSIAKCRLHALLQSHDIELPEGFEPFSDDMRPWWEALPVSPLERCCLRSDLETLDFAGKQVEQIELTIKELAARDERIPLLVQLPGVGLLTGITILAAIGDIRRFPTAKQLVGYAGLGARVHDSGMTHATGRITKAGRKDLRYALVEAANHAVQDHPRWKIAFARLEPRLGRSKALVAIARRMLVTIWHLLAEEQADRFADPTQVACGLFAFAYKARVKNLPGGQSALQFTRNQMDRLGIGQDVLILPWGTKKYKLPPSKLKT
jgi:transposase